MRTIRAEKKPEIENLDHFWDTISGRERKLLALDYDGTLAPFRVGRMEAFPLDGVVPLLVRISRRGDTTVAIVSGRPLRDLQRLLFPWKGLMIGSHGFEKRTPDGQVLVRVPDEEQQAGLAEAIDAARKRGRSGGLEVKLASVALHTRGLPEREASLVEEEVGDLWGKISRWSGLKLTRFNRGLEIRAPGWDKGSALQELLSSEPRGTFCVYIGDDLTDEDAFRAVRTLGIGIRVGDPSSPTEAVGFLPDVPAVRDFLEAWSGLGRADDLKG
jgi:trehalose 6-phosphate phosphatase